MTQYSLSSVLARLGGLLGAGFVAWLTVALIVVCINLGLLAAAVYVIVSVLQYTGVL